MRWPWQRDAGGTAAPGSSLRGGSASAAGSAEAPPSPAGWAFLPALQRTIHTQQLVTRPAEFVDSLPAWSSPALMGGMEHSLSREAPGGMLDGDGTGLPQPTAVSPDMPLAPDAAHRTGVQRTATSMTPAQRAFTPDGAPARDAVAPTLTSPGSEGFGVFDVPAVEPDQGLGPDQGEDRPSAVWVSPLAAEDIDPGPGPAAETSAVPSVPSSRALQRDLLLQAGPASQRDTEGSPVFAAAPEPSGPPRAQLDLRLPRQAGGRRLGFGAPLQRWPEDAEPADHASLDHATPDSGSSAASSSVDSGPAAALDALPLPPDRDDVAAGGGTAVAASRQATSGAADPELSAGASGSASSEPGSNGSFSDAPTRGAAGDLPVARIISGSETQSLSHPIGRTASASTVDSPAVGTTAGPPIPGSPGGLPLADTATAPLAEGTPSTSDTGAAGFVRLEAGTIDGTTESPVPGPSDDAGAGTWPVQLSMAGESSGSTESALSEDAVVIGSTFGDAAEDAAVLLPGAGRLQLPGATAPRSAGHAAQDQGSHHRGGTTAGLLQRATAFPATAPPAQHNPAQRSAIPATAVVFPTSAARSGAAASSAAGPGAGRSTDVLSRESVPTGQQATPETSGLSWPAADSHAAAPHRPLQLAAQLSGTAEAGGPPSSRAGLAAIWPATAPAVQPPVDFQLAAPHAVLQRDAPADAGTLGESLLSAGSATPTRQDPPPLQRSQEEPHPQDEQAPAVVPSGQQIEELADKLYTPLVRRLKAELLLDRERRGLRTDLH